MGDKETKQTNKVQKAQAADPTVGADPLIWEPPTIEINGVEYKMRRLGVQDTFRLARILATGAAGMGQQLGSLDLTPQTVAMLLIGGVPFGEKESVGLLASLIGVKPEEFMDPNKFPMGSELLIIEHLVNHQDLKAFFTTFGRLLKTPGLQSFLNSKSTSSNSDTGGQTK